MDTSAPNLLLIPSLQPTESLRAFMYRAAELNAFPRLYCGTHALTHARGVLDVVESRDPSLSKELRLRLAPSPIADHRASTFLLGKDLMPSSCIRIHARSICPLCISKNKWSRGEWEMKEYTSCHVHGVKLVDRCDQCQQKLTWYRSEISSCYCGRALSAITPPRAKRWERNWAKHLHLAFKHAICSSSEKYDSVTSLPKLLLIAEVVRTVLIPLNLFRSNPNEGRTQLTVALLEDPSYRAKLWEAIFLHAAETPLLLSKMLLAGQSKHRLFRNYQALAKNLHVPPAFKPELPQPEPMQYAPSGKLDMRAHVARLKQLYGRTQDESFDPFQVSPKVQHEDCL